MAGRMGSDWIMTQNIEVVKIDTENQLILLRGAVPGTNGNLVVIKETVKKFKT